MSTMRERQRAVRAFLPANERFKRHYIDFLSTGVIASVGLHTLLFMYLPPLRTPDLETGERQIAVVDLPPEVRVPPPPQQIARPATPRVSTRPISEDVTIAPTTFEQNPVESLPPPPADRPVDVREKPVYIARDVEPRLTNRSEVQRLLERLYPPMMREAGIGGTVVLWVFVETDGKAGKCQVHRSSGYPPLDEAAEQIAGSMVFSPALSRDRPVAVWIAQPINFRVRS